MSGVESQITTIQGQLFMSAIAKELSFEDQNATDASGVKSGKIQEVKIIPKKKVLVVHSHCDMSRFRDSMTQEDIDLTFFNNGLEGLKEFFRANGNFDIIVTGIIMPRMDGYSFISNIRPHTKAPIIVLTDSEFLDEQSENYFKKLDISHFISRDSAKSINETLKTLSKK